MAKPRTVSVLIAGIMLPWGDNEFLGAKLTRDAALVHPIKQDVYDILDRLIVDDPRFARFLAS